jgi:hypothetical protein
VRSVNPFHARRHDDSDQNSRSTKQQESRAPAVAEPKPPGDTASRKTVHPQRNDPLVEPRIGRQLGNNDGGRILAGGHATRTPQSRFQFNPLACRHPGQDRHRMAPMR